MERSWGHGHLSDQSGNLVISTIQRVNVRPPLSLATQLELFIGSSILGLISIMCSFFSLHVEGNIFFCPLRSSRSAFLAIPHCIYAILSQTILDYGEKNSKNLEALNFGPGSMSSIFRNSIYFDIPSSSVTGFDSSSC